MGNLVWTAITYAATAGIVLIIFRMVAQDRIANDENLTRMLWRARQADRSPADRAPKAPDMPRFGPKGRIPNA